jgi:hypothetical protein
MPTNSLPVKPVTSIVEALGLVDSFDGKPEDLQLAIPEPLLDAVGINIAIITDHILRRGWRPDGFTQGPGYRLFRYRKK